MGEENNTRDKLLARIADAVESGHLARIADALEKVSPPDPAPGDMGPGDAHVWNARTRKLDEVGRVNLVEIDLLRGIDAQRDTLLANTRAFAKGLVANNALLWGARGTGKSSLVKAVHGAINAKAKKTGRCVLVELHREDIDDLPFLMGHLGAMERRFIIFTDDLAFEHGESKYKSLKAALDGGIEGRPHNVIFYATSNRRHLMPRQMIENERSTAINPSEGVEESVSLSDRFGLWIGFHSIDQETYLAIVDAYVSHYGMDGIAKDKTRAEALAWQVERGARSGRVAWQFIVDLAARNGRDLNID